MLRPACTCALVGLVSVAGFDPGAARAENPYLAQARAQKLALDYEPALESLRRARESGDNDPDTLVEIFRLRGEIQAGLGRSEAATESFRYLLVLAPEFAFPAGTSPKVLEPYHLARAFLNQHGPLRVQIEPRPGPRPEVEITVQSDPLNMVVGAAVRYRTPDGASDTVEEQGKTTIRVALPPAEELAVIAWVFDEHGNRLVTVGTDAAPLWVRAAERTDAKPELRGPGPRPIYARWYTWAGTAAVASAVGTYFGLEKLAADRDIEENNERSDDLAYSDNAPIERRGRRAALLANISFAVAGGAAIAAGILLVRGGSRDRSTPPRVVVTPLVAPDAAGFAFSTSF